MDSTYLRGRTVLLAVMLVAMLGISVSHASFSRSFLTMQVKVNEDGSADVKNELRFFMNTADSIDLYRLSLKSTNDLAGWKDRLGLADIRFYIDTSRAPVENVRIQALAPDTCNPEGTTCYGTFIYEYHVKPPTNRTGLLNITTYLRPRVIGYELNPTILAFETSLAEEQYLPERSSVEFTLPSDAVNVKMSPKPTEYGDAIPKGATKLTWQGRLSLSNAELSFERKDSLLQEVVVFFSDLEGTVKSWITSREGIVLIAAIILIVIAYFVLERKKVQV